MDNNIIERIWNKVPYTTSQRRAHTARLVWMNYA